MASERRSGKGEVGRYWAHSRLVFALQALRELSGIIDSRRGLVVSCQGI